MLVTRDVLKTADEINRKLQSIYSEQSEVRIEIEKPIFLTLFTDKYNDVDITMNEVNAVVEKIGVYFAVIFESKIGYYHIIGYGKMEPFYDLKNIDNIWNLLYMKNNDTYYTVVNIIANHFSQKYWYFYSKKLQLPNGHNKLEYNEKLKEFMKARLEKLQNKLIE